jgi:hypothetical protein
VNVPVLPNGNDLTRVNHLKSLGWMIVTDQVVVGDSDNVKERNQSVEQGATMHVGDNLLAVLMEIQTEYYEADQFLKEQERKEKEKGIEELPNQPGQYGEVNLGKLQSK